MKENLQVGDYKIKEIYYISASELYCAFEREFDAQNEYYVNIIVHYDDFADNDSDKWSIKEQRYDINGNFIDYVDCVRLTQEEIKVIKEYIVNYFNCNYDITELLENEIISPNDIDSDTDYWD